MSLIRRCCVCKLVMGIRECAEIGVTDGYCGSCAADMVRGEPDSGSLALQAEPRANALPDVKPCGKILEPLELVWAQPESEKALDKP